MSTLSQQKQISCLSDDATITFFLCIRILMHADYNCFKHCYKSRWWGKEKGIKLTSFYEVSEFDSSGVIKQDVHCMSCYKLQNHVYLCMSLFDENGT